MPSHTQVSDFERLQSHALAATRRRRRVKLFLKYLPRRSNIDRFPGLRRIGARARDLPFLWSYKGGALIRSYYVGSVFTLLPLYGIQLFAGAAAAILCRCNLPIVAALAFVTNPLTSAPIYYGTYCLGRWLMDLSGFSDLSVAAGMVPALAIGGIVSGLLMGAALHLCTHLWSRRQSRHREEYLALLERLARQ